MSEKSEVPGVSVDQEIAESVDNVKATILQRLDDIANILNDEELSKDYSSKLGFIKWAAVREIIRRELSKEFKNQWEEMWEKEELRDKLIFLKTLTKNTQSTEKAWRPQTDNINPQKLAFEKRILKNEIEQLKTIHKEKEAKVSTLKSKLTEEWKEINKIREQISKHQESMNTIQENIAQEFENHYQNNAFSSDSFEDITDLQNTTLQGFVDDVIS